MIRRSIADTIAESHAITAEILITDARTALTLLSLVDTDGPEERERRIEAAHRAYQTVLSFLPRVEFTPEQMEVLKKELTRLEARLNHESAGSRGRASSGS